MNSEELLNIYQRIIKNLSQDIIHWEDLYRDLDKTPNTLDLLIKYEGHKYFSPVVPSTNAQQIMRRLPSIYLNDLIVISMLHNFYALFLLKAGNGEKLSQLTELMQRRQYLIDTEGFDPIGDHSPRVNLLICLTFAIRTCKEKTKELSELIKILKLSNFELSLNILPLLDGKSNKLSQRLDDNCNLFTIELPLFSDNTFLNSKRLKVDGLGSLYIHKMLFQPYYIKGSSKHTLLFTLSNPMSIASIAFEDID